MLCQQERPVIKSHIYPEWLYKTIYDQKHQYFVLSDNANSRRKTRLTGIYEKLLCGECEQKFSRWEGYASDVFNNMNLKAIEDNRRVVFKHVEYTPLKLFQMSLLWRASIVHRPEIPRMELGTHSDKLRNMLMLEDPGEVYEYGSFGVWPRTCQEIMSQTILPFERVPQRVDKHYAYRTVYGGLFWIYIVSSHVKESNFRKMFLTKEGELQVFKDNGAAHRFMQKIATNWKNVGMLNHV